MIQLTEKAHEAIQLILQKAGIRQIVLEIDDEMRHEVAVRIPGSGMTPVVSGPSVVFMSPATLARAEGLHWDWSPSLGFYFFNPNLRKEATYLADELFLGRNHPTAVRRSSTSNGLLNTAVAPPFAASIRV